MKGRKIMATDENNKELTNDDVVGLIVHAYNNFLSGMMGYSELTLLDCENPSQVKHINHSLESGHEAVHFGKTLLASIGRLQADMKLYPLKELLEPIFEKNDEKIFVSGLDSNKNTLIKTNITWFQECFTDLLQFISNYAENQKISVSLELDKESQKLIVSFCVADISMSDNDIQNLFTPFYSSKNMLGEKDIGLSKAKGFFRQMNADLSWVNGEGFLLEIRLFDSAERT